MRRRLYGRRVRGGRRIAVGAIALAALSVALIAGGGGPGTPARAASAGPASAGPAAPATKQTRYSLAGGCYAVRSRTTGQLLAAGSGPFRMQAAALGRYLLYGAHADFLADAGAPSVVAATTTPSTRAEWMLDGDPGAGFTLSNAATGLVVPVAFEPASGCAVYPEAEVGATGTPFKGTSGIGEVTGTIDAHTHVTAFEFLGGDFHCGRPWAPFGIPYALPDCAGIQTGTNGQVESFVDYGAPFHAHDTRGWPTFRAWPSPTDLAEEGDYYTGIKRAWKAGLRVMVTQLVDNEGLCVLMTMRRNPCNDMAAVHLQARDLRQLQDYIDAQSGGPGKGFFRIVTNPFEARQVINQGKLAVVEGIEVSRLFGCGEVLGASQCNRAQVDAGLKEVRDLGVSTFFPVHKFDNAFGGTKMDGGETGVLVNLGNHLETGNFWNVQTCTGAAHDNEQLTVPIVGGLADLLNGALSSILHGAVVPLYPPGPHCNRQGLTDLGAYLINKMIQQHFIVELDHMDVKTADTALSILEAHQYSGVISAHSWDSPQENPRIYNLGGFVTPIAGASPASFVAQWRTSRQIRNPRFYFGSGFGYGADMNGLAQQSQPSAAHPITYPFRSFDGGVTFDRERWGQRVFDLNADGVANYGMYPDWLQELQVVAGKPIVSDMFRGAEAYLQMWERAYGIPATACVPAPARLTAGGAGKLRLGAAYRDVLFAAGQPSSRPGRSYRYCVAGASQAGAGVRAVFTAPGKLGLITSSARGTRAGAIGVGAPARLLSGHATRLSGGVWLGQRLRGGARYVYGVTRDRVAYVAVAARSRAANRAALLSDLGAAGLR
jgi:hypothetical protein